MATQTIASIVYASISKPDKLVQAFKDFSTLPLSFFQENDCTEKKEDGYVIRFLDKSELWFIESDIDYCVELWTSPTDMVEASYARKEQALPALLRTQAI